MFDLKCGYNLWMTRFQDLSGTSKATKISISPPFHHLKELELWAAMLEPKKITGRSDWAVLVWRGCSQYHISHWWFQYLESSTHWTKFMRWTEISHCQHRLRWVMYDSHFAEIPWGDVLAGPGEIQLNWNWFQASTIPVLDWSVESRNPLLFDGFDAGSIFLHHFILSLKIMKYNFADSLTLPSN